MRIATENGLNSGAYYSGKTARLIAPVAPANEPATRRQLWQATADLLSTEGYTGIY